MDVLAEINICKHCGMNIDRAPGRVAWLHTGTASPRCWSGQHDVTAEPEYV